MQEKLNALLEDEAFLNKMLNAENPEQVSAKMELPCLQRKWKS